jgi:pimeloyl-ACP methyl ester carboxylesterase
MKLLLSKRIWSFMVVFLVIEFVMSYGICHAMECIFKDPQYSFQLLRVLGSAPNGGADIGECLSTAYRIKEGDNESWYSEWFNTAKRLEDAADSYMSQGHKVSAREAYFRATNYYRTAEFFLRQKINDPRILETWGKSRDCFRKGAQLSDSPVKPVNIPYEDTELPGYFCLVDNSGIKRPLLIIQTGFDGTGEELYFGQALAALERGYNCLLFEGPGQGGVIRKQNLPFRYDWEKVVTPVVDFALKQHEVDPEKLALMGISFGGYLAPRAVAFEHRIKACIANGGVYDFYDNVIKKIPGNVEEILSDTKASEEFNKDIFTTMETDITVGWFFGNGMWVFGAKSPIELIKMLKPYSMKNIVDNITCHMLVVDSERDMDMPGQAKQLYDALKCPKDFMLFTGEEGAEEHCQIGASMISNERILNWLDETFKKMK